MSPGKFVRSPQALRKLQYANWSPQEAERALLDLLGDGIGSQVSERKTPAPKKPWERVKKPREAKPPKPPKPVKLTPQQVAERFLEKVRRNDSMH